MNTKTGGNLRFLIFREDPKGEYTGICYDLAIVKTDTDPERLQRDLNEAAMGYVTTVKQDNLPDTLLNQSDKLPREYQQRFTGYVELFNNTAAVNNVVSRVKSAFSDPEARLFVQPVLQRA